MSLRTSGDTPWIQRLNPVHDGAITLVCFPHAGGSAGYFRPLASALAPHVTVLGVQYPGRQDRHRETPAASVAELADGAFAALRGEVGDRTFALFGHSLGAVVAFEVARRFEQLAPVGPLRLFASGRRAPSVLRDDRVHLRDDDGLLAEMTRLGGTDTAVLADPELRAMVLRVLRADYRAVETYGPPSRTRLTCPVTVLVGDADPVTPLTDVAPWDRHTTSGIDVQVFDGGHFYLDRHTTAVASAVSSALARTGARPTEGSAGLP